MRTFLTIVILCCVVFSVQAQTPDDVTGYWLTSEKESQVEIYKSSNGKYYGKIVWLEEEYEEDGSVKRDNENPDPDLRDRKILGLQILKGFEYDGEDEEWEDGKIYDPKSGKTYSCYMWFEDGNTDVLHVKGYIGISLIGRETKWTRTPAKNKQ